ncbi:uncharacterized protein METZ01_LOCUS187887, partial [marine metagenome]
QILKEALKFKKFLTHVLKALRRILG